MKSMVKVTDLSKSYAQNEVLKGITFEVAQGEVFALLGVNGAGKTTTMECIEGLRKFEKGRVELQGTLGVQLQSSSIMAECKVKEAVTLFCLWSRASVQSIMGLFGLEEVKNKTYGSLSTGQKRKLHLALALIGDPDILILDEPTAGLDVGGRIQLHQTIRSLRNQGKAIILATHDMAEVEELCDRIAILNDGRIAFMGAPAELKEQVGQKTVLKLKVSKDIPYQQISSSSYAGAHEGYHLFETENIDEALQELLILGAASCAQILDIQTEHVSLENRFIEISKEVAA